MRVSNGSRRRSHLPLGWRPLHHGSLASRAPVVPLPRYRGGGRRFRLFAPSGSQFTAQIKGGGALIDATVSFPRHARARVTTRAWLGAWARYGRARLPALRRGSCIGERTPPLSPRPRFLGRGQETGVIRLRLSQSNELLVDRSSCRPGVFPGPPGSGLRDRPRVPHSPHLQDRIRNVPFDGRGVLASIGCGDGCQIRLLNGATLVLVSR